MRHRPHTTAIVSPSFATRFATSTAIHSGTTVGGWSKPGEASQPPSVGVVAKPLKLAGAGPLLSVFMSDQEGLQNVTPPVADPSPTTKVPPAGIA